jgi:hypothetical protein
MTEILLLEGPDPAFRLAGWVLREEGFTLQLQPLEPAAGPPAEAAVVIVNGTPQGPWPRSLRPLAPGRPLLHISADDGHTLSDCEADACLHPPHSGPSLIAAVRRLLAG